MLFSSTCKLKKTTYMDNYSVSDNYWIILLYIHRKYIMIISWYKKVYPDL